MCRLNLNILILYFKHINLLPHLLVLVELMSTFGIWRAGSRHLGKIAAMGVSPVTRCWETAVSKWVPSVDTMVPPRIFWNTSFPSEEDQSQDYLFTFWGEILYGEEEVGARKHISSCHGALRHHFGGHWLRLKVANKATAGCKQINHKRQSIYKSY